MCLLEIRPIFKKLTRMLMRGGKISITFDMLLKALIYIKELTCCKNSMEFFEKSITRLEPLFELRGQRSSGRTWFIPRPCRDKRRMFLALKFFISGVRWRSRIDVYNISVAIARECIDINDNKKDCYSIKKRNEFVRDVLRYKNSIRYLKTPI